MRRGDRVRVATRGEVPWRGTMARDSIGSGYEWVAGSDGEPVLVLARSVHQEVEQRPQQN